MKNGWIAALAALAALASMVLVACGGGGPDRNMAQVRLVNASSGYAELSLRIDDTLRQGPVGYGASAEYVEVDPAGAPTLTRSGSATALLSFASSWSRNKHYTLLAYGAEGALKQLLLGDETGAPDAGHTRLRVVNAAPDAGALDVYLTGSGDALASSVPVQAGASVGAEGGWLDIDSATWRVRVTAAGDKADLRLDLPAVAFANQAVATLVLAPARGGVLVNALLLAQQGAIQRADTTQARVRVVAGVADSGAVSATVGGTVLMRSVGAPAVGLYTLLPAGTQPVVLAVNGSALAAADTTLAAGADYTLLVHGPLGAPQASWIEDDNRLPANAAQARIRLVNGTAALAYPLAMTVDFVPRADNVAAGAASPYAAVPATATAHLAVTAAGLTTPLYSADDRVLGAGSNYSVFIVGPAGSATGILFKDR
jgi:hypothetical protein